MSGAQQQATTATTGGAAAAAAGAHAIVHARVMLSRPAYSCATPDATERGVEMHFAKDAGGLFPEGLRARWMGEQAARFFDAHVAELRPGRALDVALHSLRARDGELRAHIATAQLAPLPPSWRKHLEATTNQEQHA